MICKLTEKIFLFIVIFFKICKRNLMYRILSDFIMSSRMPSHQALKIQHKKKKSTHSTKDGLDMLTNVPKPCFH